MVTLLSLTLLKVLWCLVFRVKHKPLSAVTRGLTVANIPKPLSGFNNTA